MNMICSSRRLTHKFRIMIKDRVESLSEILNCSKTITMYTTKLAHDNVRIVSWEFKDCLLRCWDNIDNTTVCGSPWACSSRSILFTCGLTIWNPPHVFNSTVYLRAPNIHPVYDMLDSAELAALIYRAFSADYIWSLICSENGDHDSIYRKIYKGK